MNFHFVKRKLERCISFCHRSAVMLLKTQNPDKVPCNKVVIPDTLWQEDAIDMHPGNEKLL